MKKFDILQIVGGEKSAGEAFLSGLRGWLKMFRSRFGSFFRSFFSRFSNPISCQIKLFWGAISFCRRAALTESVWRMVVAKRLASREGRCSVNEAQRLLTSDLGQAQAWAETVCTSQPACSQCTLRDRCLVTPRREGNLKEEQQWKPQPSNDLRHLRTLRFCLLRIHISFLAM